MTGSQPDWEFSPRRQQNIKRARKQLKKIIEVGKRSLKVEK